MVVRSVAVLGAGTMGAQIAAHFANAGVPVLLLDLTGDVARDGLKRARALKPDPFFTPDTASLVTTGGFDTDFQRVSSAEWIIEAVVAKDTPNFSANHIGVYGVIQVLRALESGKYTIEEIDAITGPALGRPKSATFRTMDIAGLDILAHVGRNLNVELPRIVQALIDRGALGEKSGHGFYKRQKTSSGSDVLTLDPATLDYRPKQ